MRTRTIDIIDPEGRARYVRRRRLLVIALIVHIGLLSITEFRAYQPKWQTLKAARKLASRLSEMKLQSIVEKNALEARIVGPDKIEIHRVSDCSSKAHHSDLASFSLQDFSTDIFFIDPSIISQHSELTPEQGAGVLNSICFDPLKGSSVFLDGLTHGEIPLIRQDESKSAYFGNVSWIKIEGINADFTIE